MTSLTYIMCICISTTVNIYYHLLKLYELFYLLYHSLAFGIISLQKSWERIASTYEKIKKWSAQILNCNLSYHKSFFSCRINYQAWVIERITKYFNTSLCKHLYYPAQNYHVTVGVTWWKSLRRKVAAWLLCMCTAEDISGNHCYRSNWSEQ